MGLSIVQLSSKLIRVTRGYSHWCPGCEEMHIVPDTWSFDGNLERPTFTPGFKLTCIQRILADGEWIGEWQRDANGKIIPMVCHYILTAGILNFCADSTHELSGKSVALPDIHAGMTDKLAYLCD